MTIFPVENRVKVDVGIWECMMPLESSPGRKEDCMELPDKPKYEIPANALPWEWWSVLAIILLVAFLLAWIVVFLTLGTVSIYAHALVIPGIGFFTVPLMFFGLLRTIFRPPALRRSRTIAFGALLFMGLFGTMPLFAPPLSTDDWTPSTPWRLPFDGEWMTLAGGKEKDRNYHSSTPSYRYGYDFTKVEDGKKFHMDGKRNEDFFCFGQPVLAPIAGKIHDVENAQPDNVPGEVPPTATLGNFVIIEVNESEFAFLAHLKQGSVPVSPGDTVVAGQVIGECGNSGRSLEPHLHFHGQNSAKFPYAESLPVVFANIQADGAPVAAHMPFGSTDWNEPNGQRVRQLD